MFTTIYNTYHATIYHYGELYMCFLGEWWRFHAEYKNSEKVWIFRVYPGMVDNRKLYMCTNIKINDIIFVLCSRH